MKDENLRRAIAHLQLVLTEPGHSFWPEDIREINQVINILNGKLVEKQ